MPTWNLDNLDAKQQESKDIYLGLLRFALDARPTPHQSGFYVRGAAMSSKGFIVTGGNHEYGITRAIHCEETLVARVLEERGEQDRIIHLAFVGGKQGAIATPCGNCRDVLKQYAAANADIVSGALKGGNAVVTPLSAYYKEDFARGCAGLLDEKELWCVSTALFAARRSHGIYAQNRQIYGAAFVSHDWLMAEGGFEGDAAYHPTLPIRNAITALKCRGSGRNRFNGLKLVVAAYDRPPYVPYLERQHLFEFAAMVRTLKGENRPIPIQLIQADEQGAVQGIWETDSDEWLPFAFSAANLGMQKALKASLENLF